MYNAYKSSIKLSRSHLQREYTRADLTQSSVTENVKKMKNYWKTKKISKFLFYKMSGSKEVICPFDSCVVDRVKYLCSCGLPQPLSKLYFCRHCLDLRCGFCVLHEVDSHYCPNCLENMPSGTYLSLLFPCIVKVA